MDRGLPLRQRLDLALGQDPGRLSEQEQRTAAIQDYIQHDPSPWRLRPRIKLRRSRRRRECGATFRWASMGKCARRY